jgi:flagellar basal-body rod modification protein FlgD
MGTSVNPLTSGATGSNSPAASNSASSDPATKLANEQTFLQLLVAQIQNQDPLNPTDSIQFVTQLAQFSEVEQMLAVRQDTDGILQQVTQLAGAAGTQPTQPTGSTQS